MTVFKLTCILVDNGVGCIATGIYMFAFEQFKLPTMPTLYVND